MAPAIGLLVVSLAKYLTYGLQMDQLQPFPGHMNGVLDATLREQKPFMVPAIGATVVSLPKYLTNGLRMDQ